jgi:hypothetical protein
MVRIMQILGLGFIEMNEHSNPHAPVEEIEILRNRLAAVVQLAAGNSFV